jgi:hypothetical protein
MFEHYVIRMEARAVLATGNWTAGAMRRPQAPTLAHGQVDFYLTEAGAIFVNALARLLDGVVACKADSPRLAFTEHEWQQAKHDSRAINNDDNSGTLAWRDERTLQRPGLVAARLHSSICWRLEQLASECSSKHADYSAAGIRTLVEQLDGLAAFVVGLPRDDWLARMEKACRMQENMLAFYEPSSPTLLFSNSHELASQMLIVDCIDRLAHLQQDVDTGFWQDVYTQAQRAEQLAELCLQALPNRSSSMLSKARALLVQCHVARQQKKFDKHSLLCAKAKQAYQVLAEQWSEGDRQDAPAVQEVCNKVKADAQMSITFPCSLFGPEGVRCILANPYRSSSAFN